MQSEAVSDHRYFQNEDTYKEFSHIFTKQISLVRNIIDRFSEEQKSNLKLSDPNADDIINTTAPNCIELEHDKQPIWFVESTPLAERAIAIQKWEGYVSSLEENSFHAHLINLSIPGYDEEVDIPYDDIMDEDSKLIAIGAPFYWSIGKRYSKSGQMIKYSFIRFKRLPAWQKGDLPSEEELAKVKLNTGW